MKAKVNHLQRSVTTHFNEWINDQWNDTLQTQIKRPVTVEDD